MNSDDEGSNFDFDTAASTTLIQKRVLPPLLRRDLLPCELFSSFESARAVVEVDGVVCTVRLGKTTNLLAMECRLVR